jgi:chromate transporter
MVSPTPTALPDDGRPKCCLWELAREFLRLGCIGFGGPLAHVALLEQEIVRKRRWVTSDQFLKGFTIGQVFPGPLSTQVAIYIGYRLHRARGAWIAGGAFILPAFALMMALTWIYFRFGMLPVLQGVFYGMTPAVLATVALSGYSLSRTTATDWITACLAFAAAIAVGFLNINIVLVFAASGLLALLLYEAAGPESSRCLATLPPLPLLAQLAWYFLKAGALIFGGGMVIVPLLQQEVVENAGWLTHREFLDGLALGQVTPGPVLITAAFIGYKVAGFLGGLVATVAIFLPSFGFVFLGSAVLSRLERSPRAHSAIRGINAAAVGAILGSCVPLSRAALTSAFPVALFGGCLIAMLRFKAGFVRILAASALLGLAARWFGY